MKILTFTFMLHLSLVVGGIGQTTDSLSISTLQDDDHPERAKRAVSEAATANRPDLMLVAMHNKDFDVRMHCVKAIPALSKVSQAHFIARVFLDITILEHADEPHFGNQSDQMQLQHILWNDAHLLLSQNIPKHNGLLTRSEAKQLAESLLQIK